MLSLPREDQALRAVRQKCLQSVRRVFIDDSTGRIHDIERVAPGLQRFRQDREDRIQIQLSKNQRRCAAHTFIGNIKMRIKWEQEPNSSIHVQRVNGCFLAGVSLHSSIKGGVLRRSRRTVRREDDIGVRVVQIIVNKIRVVLCR